jgi:hypothetical protein
MRYMLFLLVAVRAGAAQPLPQDLADTGLYVVGSTAEVRKENAPFAPQFPLWSDGSGKRRWIYLPPGTAIDASQPDAWEFPRGTKAWKEFRRERPVETRYIERLADGSWRFATYVWNAAGTRATLAPERGIAALPVADAPRGRYTIPSRADCRACHEGAPAPLLGFGALQLAAELPALAKRGVILGLPASLLERTTRIAAAGEAQAALGYLHANCGHCHNDTGPLAGVDLSLAQRVAAPEASAARTHRTAASRSREIERRIRSTNPYVRMPPLGVSVIDGDGVAVVERWIRNLQSQPKEPSP